MQGHHDWSYAYSSLSSGKEKVFKYIFLFQRKKCKQPGIFLAAKSSIDNLILNLVNSQKSVQSYAKSN